MNANPITNCLVNVRLEQPDGSLQMVREDFFLSNVNWNTLPISSNGHYQIEAMADGFETTNDHLNVECTSSSCEAELVIIMSPTLPEGATRIMMSWGAQPGDVDIHVMAIKKSDDSMCKTWFRNKRGCTEIEQDLDNTSGGENGVETVTLTDNTVNSGYTYLVAIEDFRFENNGQDFLESGAKIVVTNGRHSVESNMEATSIERATEYYLFGCVNVTNEGDFSFTPAPAGTWLNGEQDDQWLAMRNAHCPN